MGVWSAGFQRRRRHRRENYRVCTARPDAAIGHQADVGRVWLPRGGSGKDRRGSWALRRAPRSLAGSLQGTLGSWVRFQGDGRPC